MISLLCSFASPCSPQIYFHLDSFTESEEESVESLSTILSLLNKLFLWLNYLRSARETRSTFYRSVLIPLRVGESPAFLLRIRKKMGWKEESGHRREEGYHGEIPHRFTKLL